MLFENLSTQEVALLILPSLPLKRSHNEMDLEKKDDVCIAKRQDTRKNCIQK